MKKLIKNLNLYAFDNINDDNFAIDFTTMAVNDKYGVEREHLRKCHKRLHLYEEAKLSSVMNYEILEHTECGVTFEKSTADQPLEKNQDQDFECYLGEFDVESDTFDEIAEFSIEVGYDEDFIYHDRDIDYDYDYENDCEYDGDEEIYGSYGNDDYDEY